MNGMKHNVLAAFAAVTATAALAGAVVSADPARARGAGELRDLQPASVQPFDHATAQVVAVENPDGTTTVTLKVQGIDHAASGPERFPAHLHTGSCDAGAPGATSGHYQHHVGGEVSPANEIWLNFVVQSNGTASSQADVTFPVRPGEAKSIVIHQRPSLGAPAPKLACLPIEF